MEEIFGTEPIKSKAGDVNPSEVLKGPKVICVYFSMHNCPPCREFTPVFAELYNETN